MKIFFTLLLVLIMSFGCKAQKNDTVEVIHNLLIGTWVDVDNPDHIWAISKDTIRTEITCWSKYKIDIEHHAGARTQGLYWFGLSYQYCGETFRLVIENISLDNTYMKFHDNDNGVTYQFKRK
jgi:hypothetical protein